MIFLIDEMFRGTNSADRLTGAKTVISKLSELNVTGMITTHDLDLCELANQFAKIKNYSFTERYKDKNILFDYKMKPGKSTTANAKYLMEMLDIL
jgi:DNA mismatch repair ATPase MutS